MDTIVKTTLNTMSSVKKPQKTVIAQLLSALIVVQGKANFRDMSRYSPMSEKRFQRWYPKVFDFFEFNHLTLKDLCQRATVLIAALDARFMSKSGKLTDGLGMFWRGCTSRTESGLELSLFCVVELLSNTAFALKAFQTLDQTGKSRVDLYAEQVTGLARQLASMGITGLMDCQSRRKEAIHTHVNASFSALNLLKLENRRDKGTDEETVISIASWKRRKFNQHLMCRVFDDLGLAMTNEKIMDTYRRPSDYGAIAA